MWQLVEAPRRSTKAGRGRCSNATDIGKAIGAHQGKGRMAGRSRQTAAPRFTWLCLGLEMAAVTMTDANITDLSETDCGETDFAMTGSQSGHDVS